MKFNRLDIRNIDHAEFNMFAACFGFEIMENFEDIIIDIHTIGSVDFHFAEFRKVVEHFHHSLFIDKTYIERQVNGEMLNVPDLFFSKGIAGFKRMLDQEVDRINNTNDDTNQKVCYQYRNDRHSEWKKLFAPLSVNGHDHFGFGQVVTGPDEYHC